jgi:hypothetical protein
MCQVQGRSSCNWLRLSVAAHLFCSLHQQAHALLLPKAITLSCLALPQHVISIAHWHKQCHCMQLAPGLTQQLQPS